MIQMRDVDLKNKRVLIRVDFNVPMKGEQIISDKRIILAIPTIQHALSQGAAVMLMSHLGRPTEGVFDQSLSLAPIAKHLEILLGQSVTLIRDWLDGVEVTPGAVVMCENVRFNVGEKSNDIGLAQKMSALCDVFVMDAFGTAHRAQASTYGVAKFAPISCAGPLLSGELEALGQALHTPQKPVIGIVGGSKVSTKLSVLEALIDKVDHLIVGGGIANTFLAAEGCDVGHSLYEPDLINQAKRLISKMQVKGGSIPIPKDVWVAKEFSPFAQATLKSSYSVASTEMILDIGPQTVKDYTAMVKQAGTIIWNGPVGVFEIEQFATGTQALGDAIARSSAFSLAGGGDTLSAIEQFNLTDRISYISTGGGAFLEFVEGKVLPAVAILNERGTQ